MFGQSINSPFGSPQPSSGFGAPSGGFGAPTGGFGAPTPAPATGFGQPTSGFGQPTSGFGSPAPAPSGFGSFGNSTFGGGGGFGAPAPAPAFGSTGGFGGFGSANTASPFGGPAPAPPGGLFGSAPASSGGLFGSAPAPAFGAPTPAPAFGGSAFGGTTFGSSAFASAPAPSTGLFGAPAPTPAFGSSTFGSTPAPAFGAPAPGVSIFGGSPTPAPGGLFGAPPQGQSVGGGTKQTPFQPTNRQDGTSTITMQSISAMVAYENKNFDELRYEDYLQGNKGAAATSSLSFGFGSAAAPAPTGGLFGAPAPSTGVFGAPSTSPFGTTAPAPFGAPSPGAFGAQAPAFGAAQAPFGAPAQAPTFGVSSFGSSTFGKPSSGGLFGAPAPSGGLFGGGAPAPAFGAPAPTPGLFGTSATTPSLFGSPAPAPSTGLFGAPTPSTFGAPAPTPSFGFGAPAPASSGLFGSAPTSTFGAPSPGLFGAPASSVGLFGAPAPAPATGLFGSPAPAPVFGAFGSPPAPGPAMSLFGQMAPAPAPAIPPAGSIIPQAANEVLAHQIRALENKRMEIQKLDVWRGNSPEEPRVTPISQPPYGSMSNSLVRTSSYTPHRVSPGSAAKVRPRGFGAALSRTPTTSMSLLDTMGTGGRAMLSPEAYASSSVKQLVIKPSSLTPKPRSQLRLSDTSGKGNEMTQAMTVSSDTRISGLASLGLSSAESSPSPLKSPANRGTPSSIPVFGRTGPTTPYSPRPTNGSDGGVPVEAFDEGIDLPADPDQEYYQKIIDSPDGDPTEMHPARRTASSLIKRKPSYVPNLTKPGYVVTPSLDEMVMMSEAELATLTGFSVRHDPYGMIEWEGAVDVRNANLDLSVEISQSDVSVYTKQEADGCKPPVGSKLNRPAVITFFNVFPKSGGTEADEESKAKFVRRIEKSTSKMGADLLLYDRDMGIWKIRVEHFSRYGLDDDSDGDEELDVPKGTLHSGQYDPSAAWREEDDAAVVSDVEMIEESYAAVSNAVKSFKKVPWSEIEDVEGDVQSENELLFDEGYASRGEDDTPKTFFTTADDFQWAATQHVSSGICHRMAKKTFANDRRIPKNLEYGLRLGRSFRVGWSPDGTFLKRCKGGTKLQRFRPVFSDPNAPVSEQTKYLENHKSSSEKVPTSIDDGSPRIFLPLSIDNSGSMASHDTLFCTLSALAGEGEDRANAFALLSCIIDEPNSSSTPALDARRKEALSRFLVDACQSSTIADVRLALSQNDVYAAIYAALTGGNLRKACEVAVEMGQEHVATHITSYDVEGHTEFVDELHRTSRNARIPEKLRQIYQLLRGEVLCSAELGWMRCFLMRLLYDSPEHVDHDLAKVVESFNGDVNNMLAPFPSPPHLRDQRGVESILFRLIRLSSCPQAMSCSEIINPSGISRFQHDFALSFHLASCLSSAGMCAPLSPYDEEQIISSYAAQLISAGKWEWAVYVSLCCLNPEVLDSSSTDWKKTKARELILQNYHLGDPRAVDRRKLLEDVGVPSEWFFEALANRHANMGNPFEAIKNTAAFSPERAVAVLEKTVVPNILFMSSQDADRCLELLHSFPDCELTPLATAVLNMFDLFKDLDELNRSPREEVVQRLPEMAEVLEEIEKIFHAEQRKIENGKGAPLRRLQYAYPTIPLSSMLAEANAACVSLRLKLKAHEMGFDVGTNTSHRGLTAHLAFHAIDEYNEKFSSAGILRGLR